MLLLNGEILPYVLQHFVKTIICKVKDIISVRKIRWATVDFIVDFGIETKKIFVYHCKFRNVFRTLWNIHDEAFLRR